MIYGGLKVLGVAWPSSLAVVPVQCGESCSNDTGYGLWNSWVSDISGRSGKFEMGYGYACGICNGVSDNGDVYQPKSSTTDCSGWMGSMMHAFCNCCCSCRGGNGHVIVIS